MQFDSYFDSIVDATVTVHQFFCILHLKKIDKISLLNKLHYPYSMKCNHCFNLCIKCLYNIGHES